jgi:hypothetical protein
MKSSEDAQDSYDLTGKVVLTDPMARFTGNYSWVFEGALHGNPVFLFVEEVVTTRFYLLCYLGGDQGHQGNRRA